MYVKPVLEALETVELGVWIGPVNAGSTCCADDLYLTTGNSSSLHIMLKKGKKLTLQFALACLLI